MQAVAVRWLLVHYEVVSEKIYVNTVYEVIQLIRYITKSRFDAK